MSNVASQSAACQAMQEDWSMVDALMGGTTAMRRAGTRYLPAWPKEEDQDYKRRLNVATLFPAYQETVANMVGRVFATPITVNDDVPAELKVYLDNIDLEGNKLDVWAKEWFSEALARGHALALVDFPRADGLKTLADEKQAGVRPYVVRLNAPQVLGWKVERTDAGPRLVQLRIDERVEEADGEYATKQVRQIRVLTPGACQLWRKKESATGADDEWVLYDEYAMSLDIIPLVALYTGRTGYLTSTPPLRELAHLNIKHWQSQSDQDSLLHTARVPILAIFGVNDDEELAIGAAHAVKLPNQDADMRYVEHSGAAIGAGQQSITELESQMREAGAKLLRHENTASKTAGQVSEEKAQDVCALTTMANALADAINNILQLMAQWRKLPSGGSVHVHNEFGPDPGDQVGIPQTITALVAAYNAGTITRDTFLWNIQQKGMLPPDRTIEEEISLLDAMGAAPIGESTNNPRGKDPVNGGQ